MIALCDIGHSTHQPHEIFLSYTGYKSSERGKIALRICRIVALMRGRQALHFDSSLDGPNALDMMHIHIAIYESIDKQEKGMKSKLRTGEQAIREGVANLQKNIETVAGNLYLTNQRLVFEANKGNVQGGITELELTNIQSTLPCWTKFLGLIPVFPNSLAVITKEGKDYRFALFGRNAWAAAISAQIKR